MHPPPLLGVAHDRQFKCRVVGSGIAHDLGTDIIVKYRFERRPELQDMRPIGFAPGRGRHHGRACRKRDDGHALEGSRSMPKKFDRYPFGAPGKLIKRENDRITFFNGRHDFFKRAAPADHAKPRLVKPPGQHVAKPLWLDRPAQEMHTTLDLWEVFDPGDSRHLKITEMPGQDQDPFTCHERLGEFRHAFDPYQGHLALFRQEPECNQFPEQ